MKVEKCYFVSMYFWVRFAALNFFILRVQSATLSWLKPIKKTITIVPANLMLSLFCFVFMVSFRGSSFSVHGEERNLDSLRLTSCRTFKPLRRERNVITKLVWMHFCDSFPYVVLFRQRKVILLLFLFLVYWLLVYIHRMLLKRWLVTKIDELKLFYDFTRV